MAFIQTSFLGTSLSTSSRPTPFRTHTHAKPLTCMQYKIDRPIDMMLAKYNTLASQKPSPPPPASGPSYFWKAYASSMLEKIAPTVRKITGEAVDLASMQMALRQMAFLFVPPGGAPRSGIADAYIAACVERQYKMSAVPGGVYGTACTEGSVRGAAESGRVMALGKRFRSLQKGSAQKFGEAYEMRRMAIQACHECSYEEKLVVKYYKAASAVVLGESEKMGVCARYASGETKEEEYMVGCVEKQSKMRAVSGGVYDVMCQDGSVGGMAEYKRVQALAAAFRAGQAGTGVKEQRKFDARRYGRERFGHGCHYEEGLFNQYPAVGMAMRPRSVKY